jgi:hypothetical protein
VLTLGQSARLGGLAASVSFASAASAPATTSELIA